MGETAARPQDARIEIEPSRVLIDAEIAIRLSGFPAKRFATVRATMQDDLGREWMSEATFLTDDTGKVDVRTQAPQSGTYVGADPMGLVWSMALDPGETNLALFAKTGLDPTIITFTAAMDGVEAVSATLEQLLITSDVVRRPVRDKGLRGTLFVPPTPGPHPGVVVIGGSGGGLQEGHAALFASRGYAALALAYFAHEDLPEYLIDIPLEYFETAIQWMIAQPEVDAGKTALVGKSRGAEVALQLGSMLPGVHGVIAYVPSHVIWGGIGDTRQSGAVYTWTYQGQGLPYVPSRMTQEQAAEIFSQEPIALTPMFQIDLEDTEAVERTMIPVENTNGPILLISGKDDQMWPSAMMGNRIIERLEALGHPYPDRHLTYQDAGHMILTPYRPTTRNFSKHPVTGQVYAFGGTPAGYAKANKDSWTRVQQFLREAFG